MSGFYAESPLRVCIKDFLYRILVASPCKKCGNLAENCISYLPSVAKPKALARLCSERARGSGVPAKRIYNIFHFACTLYCTFVLTEGYAFTEFSEMK
jgi:hypothetical protein